MLCGISTSFPVLSPTIRQVAHALLTRPPLIRTRRRFTVRLECVMHAASVHPEPGSNSLKIVYQPALPPDEISVTRFRVYYMQLYVLFTLGFPAAPILKILTSLHTITRRTILQKVPYRALTRSMCL